MTSNGHQSQSAAVPAFDADAAISPMLEDVLARTAAIGKDPRAWNTDQRAEYLRSLCRALRLNPLTGPLQFITLNGKEVLYATRQATDQLAAMHRLNRETVRGPEIVDLGGTKVVLCQVRATLPDGRSEMATATLPATDLVNALMKCETKAKRRATLSIIGLGLLDESELETIPEAQSAKPWTPPRMAPPEQWTAPGTAPEPETPARCAKCGTRGHEDDGHTCPAVATRPAPVHQDVKPEAVVQAPDADPLAKYRALVGRANGSLLSRAETILSAPEDVRPAVVDLYVDAVVAKITGLATGADCDRCERAVSKWPEQLRSMPACRRVADALAVRRDTLSALAKEQVREEPGVEG